MNKAWIIAACMATSAFAQVDLPPVRFIYVGGPVQPIPQPPVDAMRAAALNFVLANVIAQDNIDALPGVQQVNAIQADDPQDALEDLATHTRVYVQRRGVTDAQMRAQITSALRPTPANADARAWRDGAEDKLFALGDDAISSLQTELESRDGYEADAISVALFRLSNASLNPAELLRAWGSKRFPAPDPATLKLIRVINVKQTVGLRQLFPNHLFYVIENPKDKTRAVVALAADGKVQPLEDDAALTKFLRAEPEPQPTAAGKQHLAGAAALLAAARSANAYKPDIHTQTADAQLSSTLDIDGKKQTATVTFAADGKVEAVKTTLETQNTPAPATPPPPTTAPVPATIPGG